MEIPTTSEQTFCLPIHWLFSWKVSPVSLKFISL